MSNLEMIRTMLRYSDWANGQLLRASAGLADEQLDSMFDMGLGSLRRTLKHIYDGESVWLERWQSHAETPWPDYGEPVSIVTLAERFGQVYGRRDGFLKMQ